MTDPSGFFEWQERALGWLLAWGAGCVVLGCGLADDKRPLVRHFGLQTIGWGVVDAALAVNGRRGARSKRHLQKPGDEHFSASEARRFQLLTAANALLDLGYVAGGIWLHRHRGGSAARSGAGLGIALQGLCLFGYDVYLTLAARRWSQ